MGRPWSHEEMVAALTRSLDRFNDVQREAREAHERLRASPFGDDAALAAAERAQEKVREEAFRMVGAVEAVLGRFAK